MKFIGAALLASLVAAAPSAVRDDPASPLSVRLEMTGNSQVKAVFTNTGAEDLKLLKTGTVFSKHATQRARVFADGKELAFEGEYVSVDFDNLSDDAFQPLAGGQSVEVEFDIAAVHDLSSGGRYGVHAAGRLPYAEANSTEIAGSVPYSSNALEAVVDGAQAAAQLRSFMKRANVQACQGARLVAINKAIANCKRLAGDAQVAAAGGPAGRMDEFFKSSVRATRSAVLTVFGKVHEQCATTNSGARASCFSDHGQCEKGTLAVTTGGAYMVFCDGFFDNLPEVANRCHAKSQATTFIHETTHLKVVADTDDLAYGYDDLRRLSAADAIRNADTFALFANAVNLNCAVPGGVTG